MLAGRRVLVLADRDWTHHDTGGNGANLHAQISRWVEWGNKVTVVAGDYPGAQRVESYGPRLTVHRMGTRSTVFVSEQRKEISSSRVSPRTSATLACVQI